MVISSMAGPMSRSGFLLMNLQHKISTKDINEEDALLAFLRRISPTMMNLNR